ncbi:hypothetical protein F4560_002907 [Saccharothrix ecbatanensis]|uniref:DUF218 domain-containing protein n=1 Tax=Saccharothrix ecbatanensis TaxID=1105145 RepID=A0A7W9HJT4_9PSEU|nr:YdcF family protein [Saccharothrix ecbatanensis]MBB5803139.1 hypothetical protein [Saccharothrix ecbatanensis]
MRVVVDRYTSVLHRLLPVGGADTGAGVQVLVPGGGAFGLVFGAGDLSGWWQGERPDHTCRAIVPAAALDAVASGRSTGSSVVMSGGVDLEGDWTRMHRAASGRRFRTYARRIADGFGGAPREPEPPTDADPVDVVAVLAAPNDGNGALSPMALERLAVTVAELERDPAARLVLTGGFGSQFNTTRRPHWYYSGAWLAARGVSAERVAARLETRHSYDDVLFLHDLAGRVPLRRTVVVTSDYHAERVAFLLGQVLPAAEVRAVRHSLVDPAMLDRLRRHDIAALSSTVAATMLFGPDRLSARPVSGGDRVWRFPETEGT